ncbi:MAG: M1 family aminopeptidase [Myxococcaceae bacterium]
MRTLALVAVLVCQSVAAADLPAEVQIALNSLRNGERARLEAAVGDVGAMPIYRADLTVDVDKRQVKGRYSLTVTSKSGGAEVLLRVVPNAAHGGAVTLSNGRVIGGGQLKVNQPEPSLYQVVLDPPMKPGETVTLDFELKAKIPKLPKSAGSLTALSNDGPAGDYGAFAASDDMVSLVGLIPMIPATPLGQPMSGPTGMGDFGTSDPSTIVASVTVPTRWRVVANGLAMGEVPTGERQVRFAYGVVGARELPLLLLKSPTVETRRLGDVEIEAVLLAPKPGDAKQVLDDAADALRVLEEKLSPYPYKTLRVVEMHLVNGAGGMEFPGLITASSTMLSGSANPLEALGLSGQQAQLALAMMGPQINALMKSTLRFTIAHEVAHQWSAMLVGSNPVDDPVADEPLTQHLALLVLENTQGKAAADEVREGQLKASYQLHRMLGGEDGVAARPTEEFSSSREYAALVYGKAPLLFEEERKLVGDVAWFKALKTYVEQNRYKYVSSKTFHELLAKQNASQAKKIAELKKHWWDETHGDEDVGSAPDLEGMMNQLQNGGGKSGSFDPKAMEEMEKAMKALMGE